MNALIDIVLGSFVGGLVLAMLLNISDRGSQEFFNSNADAIVQSNMSQMNFIVHYDLKKMGYGVPEPEITNVVQAAQGNSLKYLAHLNFEPMTAVPGMTFFDAIVDTIEYNVIFDETITYGDTSVTMFQVMRRVAIPGRAEVLHSIGRVSNNSVFRYRDQAGNLTPIVDEIRTVEVNLATVHPQVVLSPEMVGANIQTAGDYKLYRQELRRLLRPSYCRQSQLVSRNLRR